MTAPAPAPPGPAAGFGWAQFPSAERPARWRPPVLAMRVAVAVALVAMVPTVRALALDTGWWAALLGAVGAAVGVAVATADRWRPVDPARVAAIGVGVLVTALAAGPVAGAATLLGAGAAIGAVTFLAGAGTVRGLGPVIGTGVAAAVVGLLHPTSPVVLVAALVPALLGALAAFRPERLVAIDEGARHAVERVGDLLRSACFAVLAVPFVVLPWAVGRLVRWDTTWSPRRRGSRWVESRADPTPSDRPWQPAAPRRTWPWTRRLTRLALRLVVVVALLVVAVDVIRERASTPAAYLLEAPAMADAPYWPQLTRAQEQLRANMGLGSYAYEQPDVSSPYLNIVDGHRVTWSPPAPGGCSPPEVWMFGGSTMFGEGQRDEYTVPSWLARTAWADGVALHVTNFGQLGDPLWIEVRRLEEALGTTDDRPDLVVFYDGANEVITRIALNGE
ncbi:MAG: SGNH/GDSL hydrolase family protein, partial [Actinobacteria bacterium]|nr:SGNH/GDSL hydrolase family protein [Actinomycetota bacterium]